MVAVHRIDDDDDAALQQALLMSKDTVASLWPSSA